MKLFVFLFWIVLVHSRVIYKLKSIACFPNPKFVENVTCSIKAINWNRGVANMDCDFIQPLRNFSANLQIFKKDHSNRFQPFLVNILVNMCDVLSKRNYSAYGVIMKSVLSHFTNVNHSCPYDGHIRARGAYLDERYLPEPPLGFYKCTITIFENFLNKPSESWGSFEIIAQAMEEIKLSAKTPK